MDRDHNTESKVAYTSAGDYDLDTVKSALARLFSMLGYDPDNPLGHIVRPGTTVFIKPNWVGSRWRESCPYDGDIYSVITHPSVIEAVADYVALALKGKGRIIIGDNPSIDADFQELMDLTQIRRLESKYDVPCSILDLRPLICTDLKDYGKRDKMKGQTGDPLGSVRVNLGRESLLYNVNPKLFRGVFDERRETVEAHTRDRQIYEYSKSLYDADVYISIPKMKTHHKIGVTLNVKGLVGGISQKNHLVHWRVGFPAMGGDEYPSFWAWVKGSLSKVKERGAWNGNDTIWRMAVDIYHAFLKKDRKYFSVVDGILAGEGKGPFCPFSKPAKTLLAGENLLAVDIATTRLMGFDPKKIPYLNHFLKSGEFDIGHISVTSDGLPDSGFFNTKDKYLDFLPAANWKNLPFNID